MQMKYERYPGKANSHVSSIQTSPKFLHSSSSSISISSINLNDTNPSNDSIIELKADIIGLINV